MKGGGQVQTESEQQLQLEQQVHFSREKLLSKTGTDKCEEKQLNVGKITDRLARFKHNWSEVTSDDIILI